MADVKALNIDGTSYDIRQKSQYLDGSTYTGYLGFNTTSPGAATQIPGFLVSGLGSSTYSNGLKITFQNNLVNIGSVSYTTTDHTATAYTKYNGIGDFTMATVRDYLEMGGSDTRGSILIGNNISHDARLYSCIGIGGSVSVGGTGSIAIGYNSGYASSRGAVALGYNAKALFGSDYGVAIGSSANSQYTGVAIGGSAKANNECIAIGNFTTAAENSVVIGGSGTSTTSTVRNGVIVVGKPYGGLDYSITIGTKANDWISSDEASVSVTGPYAVAGAIAIGSGVPDPQDDTNYYNGADASGY